MSEKARKLAYPPVEQARTLFVKETTPTVARWIVPMTTCEGEGKTISRTNLDFETAAAQGRLSHGEFTRPFGRTPDLPCVTTMIRDEEVDDEVVGVICHAVTKYGHRNSGLARLTTANVVARRLLLDCNPILALTAVTTADNAEAENGLKRAFAITISLAEAEAIHPALGERYRRILHIARTQFDSNPPVKFWVFPEMAIRTLFATVYDATADNGTDWANAATTIRVKMDGELTDPIVRHAVFKMSTSATLPVSITRFY